LLGLTCELSHPWLAAHASMTLPAAPTTLVASPMEPHAELEPEELVFAEGNSQLAFDFQTQLQSQRLWWSQRSREMQDKIQVTLKGCEATVEQRLCDTIDALRAELAAGEERGARRLIHEREERHGSIAKIRLEIEEHWAARCAEGASSVLAAAEPLPGGEVAAAAAAAHAAAQAEKVADDTALLAEIRRELEGQGISIEDLRAAQEVTQQAIKQATEHAQEEKDRLRAEGLTSGALEEIHMLLTKTRADIDDQGEMLGKVAQRILGKSEDELEADEAVALLRASLGSLNSEIASLEACSVPGTGRSETEQSCGEGGVASVPNASLEEIREWLSCLHSTVAAQAGGLAAAQAEAASASQTAEAAALVLQAETSKCGAVREEARQDSLRYAQQYAQQYALEALAEREAALEGRCEGISATVMTSLEELREDITEFESRWRGELVKLSMQMDVQGATMHGLGLAVAEQQIAGPASKCEASLGSSLPSVQEENNTDAVDPLEVFEASLCTLRDQLEVLSRRVDEAPRAGPLMEAVLSEVAKEFSAEHEVRARALAEVRRFAGREAGTEEFVRPAELSSTLARELTRVMEEARSTAISAAQASATELVAELAEHLRNELIAQEQLPPPGSHQPTLEAPASGDGGDGYYRRGLGDSSGSEGTGVDGRDVASSASAVRTAVPIAIGGSTRQGLREEMNSRIEAVVAQLRAEVAEADSRRAGVHTASCPPGVQEVAESIKQLTGQLLSESHGLTVKLLDERATRQAAEASLMARCSRLEGRLDAATSSQDTAFRAWTMARPGDERGGCSGAAGNASNAEEPRLPLPGSTRSARPSGIDSSSSNAVSRGAAASAAPESGVSDVDQIAVDRPFLTGDLKKSLEQLVLKVQTMVSDPGVAIAGAPGSLQPSLPDRLAPAVGLPAPPPPQPQSEPASRPQPSSAPERSPGCGGLELDPPQIGVAQPQTHGRLAEDALEVSDSESDSESSPMWDGRQGSFSSGPTGFDRLSATITVAPVILQAPPRNFLDAAPSMAPQAALVVAPSLQMGGGTPGGAALVASHTGATASHSLLQESHQGPLQIAVSSPARWVMSAPPTAGPPPQVQPRGASCSPAMPPRSGSPCQVPRGATASVAALPRQANARTLSPIERSRALERQRGQAPPSGGVAMSSSPGPSSRRLGASSLPQQELPSAAWAPMPGGSGSSSAPLPQAGPPSFSSGRGALAAHAAHAAPHQGQPMPRYNMNGGAMGYR